VWAFQRRSQAFGFVIEAGPSARCWTTANRTKESVDHVLFGAGEPPAPSPRPISRGSSSNRSACTGPGGYPSVTTRIGWDGPRARPRASTPRCGCDRSSRGPARGGTQVPGSRLRSTRITSISGRKRRSRRTSKRLTWSGAKAFGKGPGPGWARSRGRLSPHPWFARDGMDAGPPWWTSSRQREGIAGDRTSGTAFGSRRSSPHHRVIPVGT
jgi:hypothetical protein